MKTPQRARLAERYAVDGGRMDGEDSGFGELVGDGELLGGWFSLLLEVEETMRALLALLGSFGDEV